jgi:hypothetical protein
MKIGIEKVAIFICFLFTTLMSTGQITIDRNKHFHQFFKDDNTVIESYDQQGSYIVLNPISAVDYGVADVDKWTTLINETNTKYGCDVQVFLRSGYDLIAKKENSLDGGTREILKLSPGGNVSVDIKEYNAFCNKIKVNNDLVAESYFSGITENKPTFILFITKFTLVSSPSTSSNDYIVKQAYTVHRYSKNGNQAVLDMQYNNIFEKFKNESAGKRNLDNTIRAFCYAVQEIYKRGTTMQFIERAIADKTFCKGAYMVSRYYINNGPVNIDIDGLSSSLINELSIETRKNILSLIVQDRIILTSSPNLPVADKLFLDFGNSNKTGNFFRTLTGWLLKHTGDNNKEQLIQFLNGKPIDFSTPDNPNYVDQAVIKTLTEKLWEDDQFIAGIVDLSRDRMNAVVSNGDITTNERNYFPLQGIFSYDLACRKGDNQIASYDIDFKGVSSTLELKNIKVQRTHKIITSSITSTIGYGAVFYNIEQCIGTEEPIEDQTFTDPFKIVFFSHNTCAGVITKQYSAQKLSELRIDPSTEGTLVPIPALMLKCNKNQLNWQYIKNITYYSTMIPLTVYSAGTLAGGTAFMRALAISDLLEISAASLIDIVPQNTPERMKLVDDIEMARLIVAGGTFSILGGAGLVKGTDIIAKWNQMKNLRKSLAKAAAANGNSGVKAETINKLADELKKFEDRYYVWIVNAGIDANHLLDIANLLDPKYGPTAEKLTNIFTKVVENAADPSSPLKNVYWYIKLSNGDVVKVASIHYPPGGEKGYLVIEKEYLAQATEEYKTLKIADGNSTKDATIENATFRTGDDAEIVTLHENESIEFAKKETEPHTIVCRPGSGVCFVAGTRVLTQMGLVNIEHLFEYFNSKFPIQVKMNDFK